MREAQNEIVKNNSKSYILLMSDCVVIDDEILFYTKNYNALFRLNIKSDICEYIDKIPGYGFFEEELIGSMHLYNEFIFFVPKLLKENRIWIYDLDNLSWNYIEVDFKTVNDYDDKIAYTTLYKDKIYMVGYNYKGVISINLKNQDIEYYNYDFRREIDIFSLHSCYSENGKIIIPSPFNNSIILFDMSNNSFTTKFIGESSFSYIGITKKNEYYWISCRYNIPFILRWNGKDEIIKFTIPEQFLDNGKYIFCKEGNWCDDILVSGGMGKKSLLIHDDSFNDIYIKENAYSLIKTIDSEKTIIQDYNGKIYIYMNGEEKTLLLSKENIYTCLNINDINSKINIEKNSFDVDLFLLALNSGEEKR